MAKKENEWTEIYAASNMVEAQLLKGKFESCGIPAILKYESAGQLYGITVDGLSEVKVFVPREFESEANGIMSEFERSNIAGA